MSPAASPLGVSATSRLDAEVERKYIPGFEEHVAGDSDNVEAIQRVRSPFSFGARLKLIVEAPAACLISFGGIVSGL